MILATNPDHQTAAAFVLADIEHDLEVIECSAEQDAEVINTSKEPQ